MTLVFVDDEVATGFAPFALTRPCCELRAGAELVRRRWETALDAGTSGFLGAPHLADFDEAGAPHALIDGMAAAGSIIVNSRCAVSLAPAAPDADAWQCAGRIAAVRLRDAVPVEALRDTGGDLSRLSGDVRRVSEVSGYWLDHVWDLVRHLPGMLGQDVPRLADRLGLAATTDVVSLGSHPIYLEHGTTVEPNVVFDATNGAVLVRSGAVVQAFTRLVGPCLIGEGSVVNGGRIAASAVGEQCRVSGEVSTTLFIGHANKAHDGFIGHSVLGRWVNLGASTVNSNLKNNYSDVALWTPRAMEKTGMQFLGTFFGDHAKTAIGTRLTTGSVIGAGANVFGTPTAPKYVPPFAWGGDTVERWNLEAFLETAEHVMARRHQTLTDRGRRQLDAAWHLSGADRR